MTKYEQINELIENFKNSKRKEMIIGFEDTDGTSVEEVIESIQADGDYNWLKVEKTTCVQMVKGGKRVDGIKFSHCK